MSITRIITEFKQRGVLYHFTSYGKLGLILKENRLKATQGGWLGDAEKGVSLTRNYALSSFGKCRIALDGDDLSNSYKIVPHLYQGTGYQGSEDDTEFARKQYGKEMEERVNKDITNLKRYIIQVDILASSYDPELKTYVEKKAKSVMNKFANKYPSITFNVVKKWKPLKK